ncbi:MAG TPA: hypothetical protein VI483_00635 [Candidatus Paceibacterota bacterium]
MSKPMKRFQKENRKTWQAHRMEGAARNAGNRSIPKLKMRRSKNP